MILSAILHVYWALGGTWFLEIGLNMKLEDIPPIIFTIIWLFVVAMLTAAVFALARVGLIFRFIPAWLNVIVLWGFTGSMLLGAIFNFLIPRFWDRWVFAPIFFTLAILGLIISLPQKETA